MKIKWEVVIVAFLASVPPMLVAMGGFMQILNNQEKTLETQVKTHDLVNSRMTELLELAKKESAVTATLAEKKAEQVRQDVKADKDSGRK